MLQFVFAILLVFGTQQDQVVITTGPTGVQGRTGSVSYAKGDVLVTFRDARLEASEVTYDEETNIVTAEKPVKMVRGEEHVEADHATVNVESKAGDFVNAHGEVGPGIFFTAEEAHRTAEGLYQLKNASVTTCCDGPRPGWAMALARVTIDPQQRVTAKGAVLRLESVPIFYFPYIAVPHAERSRSTGFLAPSTATSTTKGRSVREAFYWAINRSADATFTGEYFSKRGPAGAVDFRAMPLRDSRIQVETFFADDRLGQGGWSARILSFGDLGRGYRGVADMSLVSSIGFRQVYEDGINIISSPLEHSVAFLTRNQPYLSTNFLYARNGVFFADQPTVVLRKFPSIEASFPSRSIGPFYFNGETSLTGVARRDAQITTPSFAERFDFNPTFELPTIRSSLLDWSQRFGFQETVYTHSRQSQLVLDNVLNRFSFDYSSSFVGPQIERDFGNWRHVIEPSVDARYVGGPTRFQDTIVVDDVDLVTSTKEVEYAVTNRFFTKREVFSWRLAQKYFFDPTFGGAIIPNHRNVFAPVLGITGFAFADGIRRFSPIVSNMRLSTSASTSTDFEVDYDTRDHGFSSAGITGSAVHGQFNGAISYFFTKRSAIEVPSNQLRGLMTYGNRFKPGLSAAFGFSYDVQHSLFQGSTVEVGYNRNCYGLNFEVSQYNFGARVETRFRFGFTLKDIGSVGTIRPNERLF